jgi:protein-tyrosine phosphatase
MPETRQTTIIFVCLGNYCRSPMAEAIFNHLAKADGKSKIFEVSSAGTKHWDVGLPPDWRTRQILAKNGYPVNPKKRARQITQAEIQKADYLVAMSQRVADELGNGENVSLLMQYVTKAPSLDIPDPYPADSFPEAFEMILKGTRAFYDFLKQKINCS